MRIGINARILQYPSGGAREYLACLLDSLLELDQENTYVLFYQEKSFPEAFSQAEHVQLARSHRLVFDWVQLPRALTKHSIDLAFFPASSMPGTVRTPSVVSMLDLGYFVREYRMYKTADTLYMRYAIGLASRKAQRLTAISDYTAQDVVRRLGTPRNKIDVTPLAADPIYGTAPPENAVIAFATKHSLPKRFFLYTGNISPRKNLTTLLNAFSRIKDNTDTRLVITGGTSWGEDFDNELTTYDLHEHVIRLGHVKKAEMPLLYTNALAFVFPSRFEGFGLPILEAQAMAVPVASSSATSLPEVGGDGALYFDPDDPVRLAEILQQLESDPQLREQLIRAGHKNCAQFTWHETARRTLASFQKAMMP
ncbi:glycosyltransferase family 4 protein [Desulfovibrio inopinatus]|uniref:glycosyltransferase family 4 protein n=1 Tax=Desulfovibrio inopinatus TaxID=102109 RepID=UPI0004054F11|nr:glycosyltransferase family 1 protein [Desulfovibrio inopinatus]